MLTGTTRSARSLLLMLFGISCHVAASSIPGSCLARRGAKHAGTPGDNDGRQGTPDKASRFAMTRAANGPAVRDYQVELTKKLHLISVNDDLSVFLHVHPRLLQNGHFVLDQHFPAEGKYHIFADVTPAALEQQVFRFDVSIGAVSAGHTGVLVPTGTLVTAGPLYGHTEHRDPEGRQTGDDPYRKARRSGKIPASLSRSRRSRCPGPIHRSELRPRTFHVGGVHGSHDMSGAL
jgi:hypothetical protein